MRQVVLERFRKGQTISELVRSLGEAKIDGQALKVSVDPRTQPWIDHQVDGWVDGPPVTNVAAVFSARDPGADHKWRRFTVTRKGPGQVEIDVFPTPFNNGVDPLSPGIPPSASRRA